MTKAAELRTLNAEELSHHLAESREELFNLRFQLAMGKQDNSARLGHVRREIARLLTLQHQRGEVAAEPAKKPTRSRRSR